MAASNHGSDRASRPGLRRTSTLNLPSTCEARDRSSSGTKSGRERKSPSDCSDMAKTSSILAEAASDSHRGVITRYGGGDNLFHRDRRGSPGFDELQVNRVTLRTFVSGRRGRPTSASAPAAPP